MTHYEKLATMIFRILGAFLLLVGIIIAVMASLTMPVNGLFPPVFFIIFYSIPLVVLGILFFYGGRKLARWVCSDFNKSDER
jgi:ABC-type arginine transport system permease subunit